MKSPQFKPAHYYSIISGVGIWKGIRATNKLLTDATKIFRSKAFTLYEKKGGRIKAAEDFESVRPRNVIDHGVGLKIRSLSI